MILLISAVLINCRGSAPLSPQPVLSSIAVTPASGAYELPATQRFTATGYYSDGSSEDITQSVGWSSSNPSVATVSSQGIAKMVGSGSAKIHAAVVPQRGSAAITVSSLVTISVAPAFTSVTITHQTAAFSATIQGTTDSGVTWAVDGVAGGNSTAGTISTSGLYTPPGTKGFHTITATSQADLGKQATAQVAVMDDPGVFTRRYNNGRTGLNSDEIVLTPQNVNAQQFGKLFSYPVDGYVYAQPLYVANVNIPGKGYHNVVYVTTTNDTVYAFDADDPSVGLFWQTSLVDGAAGETAVPCGEELDACNYYGPEIGVAGTPVIDPVTRTIYIDAFSEVNGTYYHNLHALDITSGVEKLGGPVTLQASVPGTGQGGDGKNVSFDPYFHLQRPALLLANGLVYIGFASYSDNPPYHGWLFAYDAKTLQQVTVFNDTPDGYEGGIWQGGGGIAADGSGDVYLMTGNGDFNADSGGRDYGDSFIKLSPQLKVEDYFTPYDQAAMNAYDGDLGSGGPVLLPDQSGPHPHLMIGGGKEDTLYLIDRDNLGHYNSTDNSQIVQTISNQVGRLFGSAAYWNGNLCFEGWQSVLKMFTIENDLLSSTPVSQGQQVATFPGLTPVVSANRDHGAIVWTLDPASQASEPPVLRAYDATDLSVVLYDSNQAANSRDVPGAMIKFQVPVVVNGKVFIGCQDQLDVYGLIP